MENCFDWNAVAASAASVAAIAAVVTAWIIFWQVKEQARLTRYSVGIETLLRFQDNWERMTKTRGHAGAEILSGTPGRNTVLVIDFFDTIAKLTKKNVLDRDLVWHAFYWPMACYWSGSQDLIRRTQAKEGSATWEDYCDVMGEMKPMEAKRSKRKLAAAGPSTDQVAEFMADEKAGFSR